MIAIIISTWFLHSVPGDYVSVPSASVSHCSRSSYEKFQNAVMFDHINNRCLVKNGPVDGLVQARQRAFIPDSTKEVLLFKASQIKGDSVIKSYLDPTLFSDDFVSGNTDTNLLNYKSSLLKDVTQFKYFTVQYKLANAIFGSLTFTVSPGDNMESWFNQGAIIASYPWNVADVKSTNFNTFVVNAGNRSFCIGSFTDDCSTNYGLFCSFEGLVTCGFAALFEIPSYDTIYPVFGTYGLPILANWDTRKFGGDIRIIGVLKDNYKLYKEL